MCTGTSLNLSTQADKGLDKRGLPSSKHLYQGWLARASRRVVVVRIVKLAPFLVVGVVPPVELPQRVPAAVEPAFGEAAEKKAEELGQDLVRYKHNESAQQDEPETQ